MQMPVIRKVSEVLDHGRKLVLLLNGKILSAYPPAGNKLLRRFGGRVRIRKDDGATAFVIHVSDGG